MIDQLLKVALLGSAWVLYLLGALSVVSLAAMVERWLVLPAPPRRHRRAARGHLARRCAPAIRTRRASCSRRAARSRPRVLREALRWWDGGAEAVADAVESELGARAEASWSAARRCSARWATTRRSSACSARCSASSRRSTSSAAGASKAAMGNVMSGIAEALVATGVGLFVALPAVVAYNIVQKRIGEIESSARRARRSCSPRTSKSAGRTRRRRARDDRAAWPSRHAPRPARCSRAESGRRSLMAGTTQTTRRASSASTSRRWSTWCWCCSSS